MRYLNTCAFTRHAYARTYASPRKRDGDIQISAPEQVVQLSDTVPREGSRQTALNRATISVGVTHYLHITIKPAGISEIVYSSQPASTPQRIPKYGDIGI